MNWSRNRKGALSKIPIKQKVYHALLEKVKDKSYPVVHKYLLDSFTESEIETTLKIKNKLEKLVRLEWLYFFNERQKKIQAFANAFEECRIIGGYEFKNHYRCITPKYQNKPLSSLGSTLVVRGGRFNIGKLDGFSSFPGYYIANNELTAQCEMRQRDVRRKIKYSDSAFALQSDTNPSYNVARVHGYIDRVVDLNSKSTLKKILKILKKIEPSEEVNRLAISIGLTPRGTVSTLGQLSAQLFDVNPSYYPSNFGLPHNSQDIGRLAKDTGIQALIYNSKFGVGRCVVVFPENFKDCDKSYIQLTDEYPDDVVTKMNSRNYESTYKP